MKFQKNTALKAHIGLFMATKVSANTYTGTAGVFDLLSKIRAVNKFMPKIHLLGNTVQETMQTRLAYSCDSTSWISGGRFGRAMIFDGERIKTISVHDPQFNIYLTNLLEIFHFAGDKIDKLFTREKGNRYMKVNFVSALSYRLYQDHLNKNYPWIGLEEKKHVENQRQFADFTY